MLARAVIYRIHIANIPARTLAEWAHARKLSGTVTEAVGCGEWGIEQTAVLEIAADGNVFTCRTVKCLIETLLAERGEKCAYVALNGCRAELWNADGSCSIIST